MKIKLINMPFADANRPSLSLTQLRSRVLQCCPVTSCDIVYINQDAALYFGEDLFRAIAQQYTAGLGDWLFRHLAFPFATANASIYFSRHFPFQDQKSQDIKQMLLERRDGLDVFLQKMVEKHDLASADLVGFSSMFSQNVASFALCSLLKKRNPSCITAIGGANCESPMGQELARHIHQVDFVFSGPSLISFPELVTKIMCEDKQGCHEIGGVFSRQNVDSAQMVALAGKELPIDECIPLDYDSFLDCFDHNFPRQRQTKTLTFETSRGCWWGQRSHCTFCGLNSQGMQYRSMSANVAVEKLQEVLAYSDRCKHFACVDNIMPQNFTTEVLPKLDVPPGVEIFYEVKADLDDTQLALLAEKKITRVQPGIEALYTKILKLMKKGTTAYGNIRFLMSCARHGIFPDWNLLVGFPGETAEVYQFYIANLPLMVHLPPPGGCYPVRFDRYSPYFMSPEKFGLNLQPYDCYKDIYPLEKGAISNLAYYFQDNNYKAEYSKNMLKNIDTLRSIVVHWNLLWEGAQPKLEWTPSQTVLDTRLGSRREHWLTEVERTALRRLTEFKSASSVAANCPALEGENVEAVLISLKEKGLVFEEGSNRWGSLVLEPMT